jgi:rhodanese-related sulfurtransferase
MNMHVKRLIATVLFLPALSGAAFDALALDADRVPASKRTAAQLYLDAGEAYARKQELGNHAFFVDVRTRYEVAYVGMPTVADANIPYVEHPEYAQWDDKAGRFKLDVNGDFGAEVARRMAAQGLGKHDMVIVICRSGDRSARAANLLGQLGYTRAYSVADGFEGDLVKDGPKAGQRAANGWKNAGLPWTYKLDKKKLTIPE